MATRKVQKKVCTLTPAEVTRIDQYLVHQCGWNDSWITNATREQVAKQIFASKKATKK
jgi:hypothetical protein